MNLYSFGRNKNSTTHAGPELKDASARVLVGSSQLYRLVRAIL